MENLNRVPSFNMDLFNGFLQHFQNDSFPRKDMQIRAGAGRKQSFLPAQRIKT